MQVRFKLDTCGVKLKLHHWNQFTQEERQSLVEHPCTTESDIHAYRNLIHNFVDSHGGDRPSDLSVDPNPAWMDALSIPDAVQQKAQEEQIQIQSDQWAGLTPLQRFALIKLSRSNHENSNFLPALKEFHLHP